jgi:hypothetical protein
MFQGLNVRYKVKHAAFSLQLLEMRRMYTISGDSAGVTQIS